MPLTCDRSTTPRTREVDNDQPFAAADIGWYQGFVFILTDRETSKRYFGRNTFWFTKTLKPLAGMKRKRRKTVESDWAFHCSSSSTIKALVEEHGIDRFKREIVYLCDHRVKWLTLKPSYSSSTTCCSATIGSTTTFNVGSAAGISKVRHNISERFRPVPNRVKLLNHSSLGSIESCAVCLRHNLHVDFDLEALCYRFSWGRMSFARWSRQVAKGSV
jgi:hypothetical protein